MRKAHGPVAVLAALAGARRHTGARGGRGVGCRREREGARGERMPTCPDPNHTPVHHTHLLKR